MRRITIGLSLSLSGPHGVMGRQTLDALRLFVADANASGGVTVDGRRAEFALRCHDDRSDSARCAQIYRELCASGAVDILLGPCSSELTSAAAPSAEETGSLFVNHAGAADQLYERGYRMIVGLQTPASQYMDDFIRLLGELKIWHKRLGVVTEPTLFSSALAHGVEESASQPTARRRGVQIRMKWDIPLDPEQSDNGLVTALRRTRLSALLSAGNYSHDVAVIRAVRQSRLDIPVIACAAAGLGRFHEDLGPDVEGIVGTSQWEPGFEAIPELGPDPREFAHRMRTLTRSGECDYIAAQAYAAGVLVAAVLDDVGTCDQVRMRERFSTLRTGTLFGAFAIDPQSGRQTAHRVRIVRWSRGRKQIVKTESVANGNPIELPSLWTRLAARMKPDDAIHHLN